MQDKKNCDSRCQVHACVILFCFLFRDLTVTHFERWCALFSPLVLFEKVQRQEHGIGSSNADSPKVEPNPFNQAPMPGQQFFVLEGGGSYSLTCTKPAPKAQTTPATNPKHADENLNPFELSPDPSQLFIRSGFNLTNQPRVALSNLKPEVAGTKAILMQRKGNPFKTKPDTNQSRVTDSLKLQAKQTCRSRKTDPEQQQKQHSKTAKDR